MTRHILSIFQTVAWRARVTANCRLAFKKNSCNGLLKKFGNSLFEGNALDYGGYCFLDTVSQSQWRWEYRYSAGGERESKRMVAAPLDGLGTNNAHPWTYYLLGGNKQQLAVYNGLETDIANACSDTGHRVHFYPTEYLTYANGMSALITTRPTGAKEYKIVDHLGSTRVILNDTGGVISQFDYEPFGELFATTEANPARKGYIDKELDRESGTSNLGLRQYGAKGGIFTSTDALWEKYRAWSPYQYSRNNPLVLSDPSGLGDYLDGNGKKLGTDGVDDKKRYLTTSDIIGANTTVGGTGSKTDWAKVQATEGTELLPSAETLQQMKEELFKLKDDYHYKDKEAGGTIAIIDGKEQYVAGTDGKKVEGKDNAYFNTGAAVNKVRQDMGGKVLRTVHSHPWATLPGGNTAKYYQTPSTIDMNTHSDLVEKGIISNSSILINLVNSRMIFYNGNNITNSIDFTTLFSK